MGIAVMCLTKCCDFTQPSRQMLVLAVVVAGSGNMGMSALDDGQAESGRESLGKIIIEAQEHIGVNFLDFVVVRSGYLSEGNLVRAGAQAVLGDMLEGDLQSERVLVYCAQI